MSEPMKHLLKLGDLTTEQIMGILNLADQLKYEYKHGISHPVLAGKTLGMIFQKSSTRTRVSFEVGMYQLGGNALFLSSRDLQIGRGEPIQDTARVLSRYLDGIMIRTFAQQEVEDLAKYGSIPIINGLTDYAHPCQVLADLMTIRERKGSFKGLKLCFIGDGNNMPAARRSSYHGTGCASMFPRVARAGNRGFFRFLFQRWACANRLLFGERGFGFRHGRPLAHRFPKARGNQRARKRKPAASPGHHLAEEPRAQQFGAAPLHHGRLPLPHVPKRGGYVFWLHQHSGYPFRKGVHRLHHRHKQPRERRRANGIPNAQQRGSPRKAGQQAHGVLLPQQPTVFPIRKHRPHVKRAQAYQQKQKPKQTAHRAQWQRGIHGFLGQAQARAQRAYALRGGFKRSPPARARYRPRFDAQGGHEWRNEIRQLRRGAWRQPFRAYRQNAGTVDRRPNRADGAAGKHPDLPHNRQR